MPVWIVGAAIGVAKLYRGRAAVEGEFSRVEVNRLWNLNADRIATGDPDLIMPGQKLRL